MKYTIIKEDNGDLICIDRVSMKIQTLKWGHFEDITKKCKRMASSKTKRDCMGAKWYLSMQDGESISTIYSKVEHFESKEKFFSELVKRQIEGAKSYLGVVENYNNWVEPHCMGY